MLRQQTVRMGSFPRTLFLHTGVYLAGSDKRHGALKGCYRFLKLFSWSYIYTRAQTVLLCRGWIKIELMRCGSDMAGGWEEKEIVHVFYTVPCGVNPTNTTTRVHWVKSKGKTFHLCARIVSYFTSNVRHSKSMGTLWLRAHNCLIRCSAHRLGTGNLCTFTKQKVGDLKKKSKCSFSRMDNGGSDMSVRHMVRTSGLGARSRGTTRAFLSLEISPLK